MLIFVFYLEMKHIKIQHGTLSKAGVFLALVVTLSGFFFYFPSGASESWEERKKCVRKIWKYFGERTVCSERILDCKKYDFNRYSLANDNFLLKRMFIDVRYWACNSPRRRDHSPLMWQVTTSMALVMLLMRLIGLVCIKKTRHISRQELKDIILLYTLL